MFRHFISVAIVYLFCVNSFATQSAEPPTQLPRGVRPTHYAISLIPNASAATFAAKVNIHIDVLQPTAKITLNALELSLEKAALQKADSKAGSTNPSYTPIAMSINQEQQTATFEFSVPLDIGAYVLSIDYSGIINGQTNGLFFIDYTTPAGSKRALYTQFENSDARRFIPSWDEPAYKATFALDVTVPDHEMAVSNMPVASQTKLVDGRKLIRFATTPKMSTYLLFFGLGEFERVAEVVDGTEVGIVSQKGDINQASFALAASKEVLHEYNDYFAIPYPLPKLDNVAAPGKSQFFSAMENWGAIFTFEHAILLNPSISTQRDKENIFIIAAHEIAHQWFGNLVTMRWWDDLWLNEGFASWMENHITQRLHPEWSNALATINVHEAAMELDSLSTTHPVVQRIDTVEQASAAFDEISYQKGESVIRMLEHYLGSENWRDGVRHYLKKHAYGNTTSDDLWEAMEHVTAKPIKAIAHDFTLQPGVPLIKVDQAECSNGRTTMQLTQAEFSRDDPNKKPLRWRVPVTARGLKLDQVEPATVQTLVTDGEADMVLAGCQPVIINAGQTGYFRTLYTPIQFNQLNKNFSAIDPIDQLGLLSDSWALGLAGLQPVTDFLNLANGASVDTNPYVWSKIASIYSSINQLYRHTDHGNSKAQGRRQFREFAIAKLTPVMTKIGWNAQVSDTTAVINLREQLIDLLSQLGDEKTIAEANRRYAAQDTHPEDFPVELRKAIMRVVALHANANTWEKLRAAAHAETSEIKQDQLYTLLASSDDPKLAQRALNLAISKEAGTATSAGMVSKVAQLHPDLAYEFAVDHLKQIEPLIDSISYSRYFPNLAFNSVTPAMVDKLNTYANKHLPSTARSHTHTVIAQIRYRMKLVSERLPQIDRWLAESGR